MNITLYFMKSTISSKGQITVPVAIRQALGLRAGTIVSFEQRPEGALLRRAQPTQHPVDEAFGALSLPAGVDGLLDSLRGGRPAARRRRRAR
jgi:AbrB family looped-hinge helix DNA binding protein